MKKVLTLLFLATLFWGCAQSKSKPITELSQKDIESSILLDVRTPQEFGEGHLEGAVNMDWFDESFQKQAETLDKSKPILIYCKMGGRSAKATQKLQSMGFDNVVNLSGGYDAYVSQKNN
ncbi:MULTISPECIES: rhodanese-like domain-containing protein [Bacteroidota]|uniref:Rhodanese-like domain-containing protein n=1 Tax=Euzebyella saccharophila TaxID=679664 RepID=A0ABV8JKX3_9FLAO|nr:MULTISPECIES: rhodanese-like domain-containing protein [Bacteroidota]MBC6999719.1 rhodanese-like domain-containing protein [Cytophaga sp. FL35]